MRMQILLTIGLFLFTINISVAETFSGIVQTLHYNADSRYAAEERGLCIKLAAPADTNWKCLYKNKHLYKEINSVLVMSKMLKKPVTIITDSGTWNIYMAEMN